MTASSNDDLPEPGIRSGFEDYSEIHGNKWYDACFERISEREFIHTVFRPRPGLWNNDRTFLKPYRGQEYDPAKWTLEEDAWDHEHCTVCSFSIDDGYSYWEGARGGPLCDACHEYYFGGGET